MIFALWWHVCEWRLRRAIKARLRWEARKWRVEDMMRLMTNISD